MPTQEQELFHKLTNLTLNLQKEVAELKEDTIVNASHIQLMKASSKDNLNDLNSSVNSLNNATNELVSGIEEELNKTSGNNYAEFLKTLLKEDFKALQNEMIEQTKRELLNAKTHAKTKNSNPILSFIQKISPVLSIISFTLLIIICVKFKIFGMLFQ